jgi:hypothetical protein
LEDPVLFDINGDGVLNRMAWTEAGADEAFLWQDKNENGVVDNGAELLLYGFDVLAAGDLLPHEDIGFGGDGNGVLDTRDRLWSQLKLWIDANHDGMSQAHEIFSLAEKGVLSIDLNYRWFGRRDRHGNLFKYGSAVTLLDGHGNPINSRVYDVYFRVEP